MKGTKRIACVIPARLESTRFPKKLLKKLAGKPILQWVWEAATNVKCFDHVVFAIDDSETAKIIKTFATDEAYVMTSKACPSGTDRLIEVAKSGKFKADIWVNWQGDEPFLNETDIDTLLQSCEKEDTDMWTLKKRITKQDDVTSPNIAKVVSDSQNRALYFSRSPIPFYRENQRLGSDSFSSEVYFKHIGLYAYTTQALEKISLMNETELETAECLEQLRFLQHGLRIKLHESDHEVIGVDTPEDLARAEKFAKSLG